MRRPLLLVLLLLLCYAYVLPRWADWSQTSRLALVRAIVEQGTVRIDSYVASTGDYALVDGHAYSDKAPGPALLAVPVYAVVWRLLQQPPVATQLERIAGSAAFAGTVRADGAGLGAERVALALSQALLTLVVVALPTALALAALDWLLRRWFQPGPALLATLGVGLATPLAPYAGNFYSHALVAALLVGGWALIERSADRRNDRLGLVLGGLLLGYAAISEYPSAVIGAALGCYALHRVGRRALGWLILGGLPPLALLAVYDWLAFGTVWPVGYAHSALWQAQHHTGFLSLTYPHLDALWGLLAGRFRGLFVRAPWLLLALPGAVGWWRTRQRRALLALTLGATAALVLVYASSRMWWGGFGVGPRYIVPMLPFLAVPAAWSIERLWPSRLGRTLALCAVSLSLLLVWGEALAGQQFPPDTVANPWLGWTVPAWQQGALARNAGMALGLSGTWSLLPLALGAALLLGLLVRSSRSGLDAGHPAPTANPSASPLVVS